MAKFRQQSPPFQYSLSSPSLSRGPNPGSCFSSFSSRLQRFKELREGGREGRKDRREGGQRRIGKCRVEMHLRFFVREIRAEPPPTTASSAPQARWPRGDAGDEEALVAPCSSSGVWSAGVFSDPTRKMGESPLAEAAKASTSPPTIRSHSAAGSSQ